SLGDKHGCLINSVGTAKCWGSNSEGQLGNGGTTDSSTAVTIPTLVFKSVGVGSKHSCAVTSTGGIKCWGNNASGQLGDSTLVSKSTPVDVSGLTSGYKTVVSGATYSCALTTGGGVKCWGSNATGSLGNSSFIDSNSGVDVTGLGSGVKYLFANRGGHSCVVTTSGGAKCWGDNRFGQLGDGTQVNRSIPVDVAGLTSGVDYLYLAGFTTCAKLSSGAFKCWGNNQNGQLGDSTNTNRLIPVDLTIVNSVRDLSLGESSSCALKTDSTAVCWGYNTNAQINSNEKYIVTPIAYPVTSLIAHRSGMSFQCSMASSGSVQCRGLRTSGQTVEGTTAYSGSTSVSIKNELLGSNSVAEDVSIGKEHLCFTSIFKKVYCLGSNDNGEIGDGSIAGKLRLGRRIGRQGEAVRPDGNERAHHTLAAGRD
ncbi:MAG: RCC1 repeat-containing protein, partial [Cytophagaceae bacterium]